MLNEGIAISYRPKPLFQKLRRTCAELLGRERANQISAPFYDWQARRQTRRMLLSLPKRGLCVNLGCGYSPMQGWVNVDKARGPQVDIVWDLRRGLPFADSSCEVIFGEHMIEHLSKTEGEMLLDECYRVLQPGGVLRISTPDAERYFRSYAGDQRFLHHPDFTRPIDTPLDRINQMMRECGQHLWVYDSASLQSAMRRAGFSQTINQRIGVSLHPKMLGIDAAEREFESLYVEAVKER